MEPETLGALPERAAALPEGELKTLLEQVSGAAVPYTPGSYRLTDDKAPVELLGMSVIDGLISRELDYYQEAFREGGISGVLDAIS